MVNEALLEEGVRWARMESQKPEQQREWLQGAWLVDLKAAGATAKSRWSRSPSCGTAGCIAGWAVVVSGERLGKPNSLGQINETKTGRSIPERAKELLDITEIQADRLFSGGNDIEDIETIAEKILGHKVV